jgi:hypothetical protein
LHIEELEHRLAASVKADQEKNGERKNDEPSFASYGGKYANTRHDDVEFGGKIDVPNMA